MNFYKLAASFDVKVCGTFPQVEAFEYSGMAHDPHALGMQIQKVNKETLVPKPILRKQAKKTDYISTHFGNAQPVLSARCKDCFSDFTSGHLEFVESTLILKDGAKESCWFINPYGFGFDALDMEQTEVHLMQDAFSRRIDKRITAKSSKELQSIYEVRHEEILANPDEIQPPIVITKAVFRPDFDKDLFCVNGINGGMKLFLSEKLREAIESSGLTGMRFTDVNERH